MKGFGYLLNEGIKNVWNNRMMSIASVGVLISCLLLTGAAALLGINVQKVVSSVGDSNMTTVYLDDTVSAEEAEEIGAAIKSIKNIDTCEFYSKDEAIGEYEEMLGDIFSEMQGEQNPLPDAYHISMADLSQYDETVKKITDIKGVYKVSNRSDVAQKLTSLSNLVTTMGILIVLILGAISLFIIANTIKMTMHSRRFEISIMKSVGATNNFVRIPFIVEGAVIGAASGVISAIILYFLYDAIMKAAQNIVPFTYINFSEVALTIIAVFVLSGILIGALGAIISIEKYLKKEGNEILGW